MIAFELADARRDRAVLTELDVAYLDWLDANIQETFGLELPALSGQPIAEYVAVTLDKLCAAQPPEGVFDVVRRDRHQNTIAVVFNMTDGAIGSGDSQRHDKSPGVAVSGWGKE